ncbi:hypothetical protein Hanom_Chr10g00894391 [Helianthus anomalus]
MASFIPIPSFAHTYMDSEIRAIMAQYMPLDNQAELATQGPNRNV